ncbi:hypothetical protein ABZX77_03520 [Streptomyces sp. NPDC004237]|uniref:hypothetical protein n=1 Tax=Streptomyces sp. NPDC004237 TaxID=3154455 RepID=UPI0033AFB170
MLSRVLVPLGWLLSVLVVVGLVGASLYGGIGAVAWLKPPAEGLGPYLSPGAKWFLVSGVVASVVCLIGSFALPSLWDDLDLFPDGWVVGVAALLVFLSCLIMSVSRLISIPKEVTINATGFVQASSRHDGRFLIRNATGEPVTVCVGEGGWCETGLGDMRRLWAPGATIPPGGYLVAKPTISDFGLTIVRPTSTLTNRDTAVHVKVHAPGI